MIEKELASKNVSAMVDALNNAIAIANNLGLRVDISEHNTTCFADKVPHKIYSARVYEETEYK